MRNSWLLLPLISVALACGGELGTTSPDASSTSGPQCNALENLSGEIGLEKRAFALSASDPVSPPADGTYLLIDWYVRTGEGGADGPTSETARMTLQVEQQGTRWQFVSTKNGGAEIRKTFTLKTEGSGVLLDRTCPAGFEEISAKIGRLGGAGFSLNEGDDWKIFRPVTR